MFKRIYIEITNVCNLNCSFCIGNQREKKFVSVEEFSLLLNKLEGHTKYLYFHVMGEPLLHPQIQEFITMASRRYFVNITSNGYFVDKIKENQNIRQLNLSLHSFDLKYGKSLEDYMQTIFNSVDVLARHQTIIKYRLWVGSSSKEKIIKMLSAYYHVAIGDARNMKLGDSIYYEVEDEFIWPTFTNSYFSEIGSCRGTRDHLGILVDGTVIPCCLDSAGIISLGNIYKQDLNDIINGELFKQIRDGFQNNKKVHPLCKKCNFYELRR